MLLKRALKTMNQGILLIKDNVVDYGEDIRRDRESGCTT